MAAGDKEAGASIRGSAEFFTLAKAYRAAEDKDAAGAGERLIECIDGYLHAQLAARPALDLDDLRRFSRLRTSMAPARKGDYVLFADVQRLLSSAGAVDEYERLLAADNKDPMRTTTRMRVHAAGRTYDVDATPQPGLPHFTGLMFNAIDQVERDHGVRGGFVTLAEYPQETKS